MVQNSVRYRCASGGDKKNIYAMAVDRRRIADYLRGIAIDPLSACSMPIELAVLPRTHTSSVCPDSKLSATRCCLNETASLRRETKRALAMSASSADPQRRLCLRHFLEVTEMKAKIVSAVIVGVVGALT